MDSSKQGISNQVNQLAGVFLDGIQFLGGTLGESQVVEPGEANLILVVHQQLLGRRRIHLPKRDVTSAELAIGVTRRPAIRTVIPDVQVFSRTYGATGIAFAPLATSVMTFHGDKGGRVILEKSLIRSSLAAKHVDQVVGGHHLRHWQTGRDEEGGC